MPLLSIITINLNNALGLHQTINSVINQIFIDYEYIIIDGGSSDDSLTVIKKFDSKITHWISESDNGIYHAMNKGIRIAKGFYCQFLNSGDQLANNLVIKQMCLNSNKNEIIIGNMLKMYNERKIIRDIGLGNKEITFYDFYKGTVNHSPAFIPRTFFYKYGFYDETLSIVSDWKWYLIAIGINNAKIRYQNTDVTIFNMTGISNSNKSLLQYERRKVLNDLIAQKILMDYDKYFITIRYYNILKFNIVKQAIKRFIKKSKITF